MGTVEQSADLSGGHVEDMPPGLAGDSCATDLPLCPQSLQS